MHLPFMRGRGLVARFSQYAGFRPKTTAKGKKAEGDEKKKGDDDDDDDTSARKSGAPENGEDGNQQDDQEELSAEDDDESMEDDEDDEKMSADDEDDDEDDKPKNKKKGKKAKRAAADDDDEKCEDEDDSDKKAARRRLRAAAFKMGRRAERARWTKILSSSHAANSLDTALRLASSTSLHSGDVIAELRKVGASHTSSSRRASNPRIGVETADAAPDQRATAQIQSSWAKAFAPTLRAN